MADFIEKKLYDPMKRVLNLINSLKPSEIELVRTYYRSLSPQSNVLDREKLLTLALTKKDCTDQEALRYLYGKKNCESQLAQLKQRLRNDILNILLIQDGETKFRSKYAQAVFNCRRAIIHGELLLSRGVYEDGIEALEKARELAEHNELYAEQVQIDDLFRSHLIVKEGADELDAISKRMDTSMRLLQASISAKHLHYEFNLPGHDRDTYQAVRKELLLKMKTDFESTGSLRVGFYYHLSAINYHTLERDFLSALLHSQELLGLVRSSPAFQSDSFIAGANMEIATALIHLERYPEAREHAQVAIERFRPGMLNELLALEKLFLCCIRTNDVSGAKGTVTRAFANKKISYNEFLNAKWWFFKAATEYLSGSHAQAIRTLKNCDALLKDKTGWMLGFTLFEMIVRIETCDYDWVESRTESLKKIIRRYANTCTKNGDGRMELIFQLVRSLRRVDYDFERMKEAGQESLALLGQGNGIYYWNPGGYELFRFERWIESRVTEPQRTAKRKRGQRSITE